MFLCGFNGLPSQLSASASTRELRRGEFLCRQGDPVQAVYVVLFGRVQLCVMTNEGKQITLYTARAGECVAEAALFAESYCSDGIAETRSCVRAFSPVCLRNILRDRPDWAAEFMKLQARRCHILRTNLELRSLRTARQRILKYVAVNAAPGTKTVTLDRSLKSLSDDLGLTPESFYRTLGLLSDQGIVRRTKTTIEIQ